MFASRPPALGLVHGRPSLHVSEKTMKQGEGGREKEAGWKEREGKKGKGAVGEGDV